MASLNDLKALALSLPPSERVSSGEVGDVLSAVIAVGQYGDKIIDAAKDGKIGDFFHQVATDAAEEAGVEAPRRGSVPVEQASTGQNPPASGSDARLKNVESALARILDALEGKPAATDPTDVSSAATAAPVSTTDTPAPDVVAAADTVANPDTEPTAS